MMLRLIIVHILLFFIHVNVQAQVVANYRFDDCKYIGASAEVLDQTGTYSATSYGSMSTFTPGKIALAANISSEFHHIETAIPLSNQFSISTWFKKPTSTSDSPYFVLGAMQAGGDLLYLDRGNGWRWGVYNASTGAINGTYSFAGLNNDWHHMALVYNAGQTQLYIDGTLQDTVNRAPSGTLKYIGTSYDGVSSSNPQGFRAPLDEFIVFDNALTPAEVADIYSYQFIEKNYDGSSRAAVSCSNIIAEYRFDETEYSDTPNEIIDSVGGFNGQAQFSQPIEGGVVCNALDLSASGTSDYAIIDSSLVDGKTDFTVSLWVQSGKTANQSILSGAGSNNNEMLMWFIDHDTFRPYLKNSANGDMSTATIADNLWHHLVWTRQGSQSCLYQDNALKGCVTQSAQALSVQSLVLGQEQDNVGGGFDSSQAFEGLIDEVLIFDGAISSAEIDVIYDNQSNGFGYDGSSRTCPPPPPITPPILDLHFDENDWSGADSVLDSSGNDFHANSTNVAPALGKVCNAADLTVAGVNDYITLDKRALDGRNKFSISLWYKTPKTGNQSIISGSNPNSFNELIMWFTSNTRFSPFLHEGTKSITTGTIGDDEWHHLVWTRSGSTNLFYRDGVLQPGSAALSSQTLDISSLILGQEQDNLGGGFASSQAVEGLVDELLIYDRVISGTEVNEIFGFQKNGFNYDGSDRVCPPPPPITPPIADIRFDEDDWSLPNSVLDSSGNDFHATATNVSPVVGKVCNAADMTASGIGDYITLDSSVLDTRSNFTISLWLKSPKTTNQSLLSGSNASSFNELIMWFTNSTRFSPFLHESTKSITTLTIGNDQWHHLVWTRAGTLNKFYRDGVLQTGSAALSAEALSITSLILGQEQDNLGGGFASSQAVEGIVDELLVFDRAIPASEVDAIFKFQTDGFNYDGTVRNCEAQIVLDMHFDEIAWTGAAGEVLDQTGSFNGQAKGGVTTANSSPALSGNPGTCRYGEFDGIDDYVEIGDAPELDLLTELSVATWIKPESIPSSGLKTILSKDENYEFHLNSSGEIFWWWGTNSFSTSGAGISAGNWYHVAITYKSGKQSIYVNGVEKGSRAFTGNLPLNNDPLQIGQDQGYAGRYFHGLIDEVSLYSNALSATDVNDIYLKTHPCISYLDHFEITHDGQGLTCEEETITIKACEDAACTTLNTDTRIVQLAINGTPNKSVTVTGGTVTTQFAYTNVGIAALSLDQSYQCKDDSSTASCDVLFASAAFRFLYGATESSTIDHQVSGNNFNETVKLQAVEDVNGVCTGLFTGNKDVELSQQNINPGSSTGLDFKINGAATGTAIGKYPLYTPNITLNFGSDSKAVIPAPVYLDAGEIRLHVKYDDGVVNLEGKSNDFWVSPDKLLVSAKSALGSVINGNSNTSTTIHKAGQAFDFTVTAVNAQNNATLNYLPNDIQLLLTRTAPTGGINGNFNYGNGVVASSLTPVYQSVSLTPFNSGVFSTNSAMYSEVGLLNLDLQDVNYGFAGNTIVGDAINIGRFTPAYFEQSVVEPGSLDAVCNQNTPFVYTGQTLVGNNSKGAISYLLNPVVELTAKNAQGVPTQNYTQPGFMKLVAAANFIVKPTTDALITGNDGNLLPLTSNINTGTVSLDGLVNGLPSYGMALDPGVLHYELSTADNFYYPRNANSEIIAQDNDINFLIDQANFTDSDDVGITTPVDITNTAGINLRFGRAYLANSFGPETADLPQPFTTQYLNTSGHFVTNDQDDCTSFDSTKMTLTSGTLNKSFTGVDPNSGQFDKGKTNVMFLTAPGAGNQGSIDLEYDIDAWLKYDWFWDGVSPKVYTDNPIATATFGQFRGNDRIIYQREVNN